MAGIASRRTIGQLIKQGWDEIPEVLATTGMGVIGLALAGIGAYNYYNTDGDNRRYKWTYVVMRPDDPKAKLIRKD